MAKENIDKITEWCMIRALRKDNRKDDRRCIRRIDKGSCRTNDP